MDTKLVATDNKTGLICGEATGTVDLLAAARQIDFDNGSDSLAPNYTIVSDLAHDRDGYHFWEVPAALEIEETPTLETHCAVLEGRFRGIVAAEYHV